jgi:hypothetical protein
MTRFVICGRSRARQPSIQTERVGVPMWSTRRASGRHAAGRALIWGGDHTRWPPSPSPDRPVTHPSRTSQRERHYQFSSVARATHLDRLQVVRVQSVAQLVDPRSAKDAFAAASATEVDSANACGKTRRRQGAAAVGLTSCQRQRAHGGHLVRGRTRRHGDARHERRVASE